MDLNCSLISHNSEGGYWKTKQDLIPNLLTIVTLFPFTMDNCTIASISWLILLFFYFLCIFTRSLQTLFFFIYLFSAFTHNITNNHETKTKRECLINYEYWITINWVFSMQSSLFSINFCSQFVNRIRELYTFPQVNSRFSALVNVMVRQENHLRPTLDKLLNFITCQSQWKTQK